MGPGRLVRLYYKKRRVYDWIIEVLGILRSLPVLRVLQLRLVTWGSHQMLQSTPIFSSFTQYSIGTSARDTTRDLSATSATAATSSSSSARSATTTPCSPTTISQSPRIAYGHRPQGCTTTNSINRLSIALLPDPVPIFTTSIPQNPADHPANTPRSHRACQWQH